MKLLLTAFVVLTSLFCDAQKKQVAKPKSKEFVWPKPIGDSTWFESRCDTMYGKIEIEAGSGKIVGDGMTTSCMTFRYVTAVYSKKGKAAIDSFYLAQMNSDNGLFVGGGTTGWGTTSLPYKTAYIKSNGQWARVEGTFVLTPY